MKKYFTLEGFKKLKEELAYLQTDKRKEIADRLEKAIAFGDLSENAEYSEAKESQAFMEGRILELEELISDATVVSANPKTGWVQIGSVILASMDSKKTNAEEFKIVGAEEAAPLEGKISIDSPLGKAFLNKPKGAVVEVDAPAGKIKYKILEIK
ncbi:transcription elongation factor GreA [Candidatus Parcubacteria bacterium]|nr:transcription elongation factor GreA [Candidatus Parcubacteria bacterium]